MKTKHILLIVAVVAAIGFAVYWNLEHPVTCAPPLDAAIALLDAKGIPVPEHEIIPLDVAPPNASPNVEAWVYHNDNRIFVLTTTATYQKATACDPTAQMRLASALIHESVHASGVLDERTAYQAQLDTLAKLDAPFDLIRSVELARDTTLNKLR